MKPYPNSPQRPPIDPPLPVDAEQMDPPEPLGRPRRISRLEEVAFNGITIAGIGITVGVFLIPAALPAVGARTSVRLERQQRLEQIAALEADELSK